MAIEFFIPLREEAVAIDHAAGIELGGHNTLEQIHLNCSHTRMR